MARRRDPEKTRKELLEAAYREIRRHGYQSASLDCILQGTDITKGALYHHFSNKTSLGHAVVEEMVGAELANEWNIFRPNSGDGLQRLCTQIAEYAAAKQAEDLIDGCTLQNLSQEMCSLDEGFRERIRRIYDAWAQELAVILKEGQEDGSVRKDVEPEVSAAFVIAVLEGNIGVAKCHRDIVAYQKIASELVRYLKTLRPG